MEILKYAIEENGNYFSTNDAQLLGECRQLTISGLIDVVFFGDYREMVTFEVTGKGLNYFKENQ